VKGIRSFRVLTVAAMLSLTAVVLFASPALAAPEIALSPTSGSLGTKVTVSGINFESYRGDTVSIYFDDGEVETLVVPDNGEFTAEFFVPDDAAPGRYYVAAQDEMGNQLGMRKPLLVEAPEVTIYPEDGVVGADVTVSGTGFYAGGRVIVYYDGARVDDSTEVAGAAGEFSCSFAVPESTAGDHQIRAEDALGYWDEADFNMIPSIAPDSSSAIAGDSVTMIGTGFDAASDVTVRFDRTEVAEDSTDKYGSFEISFDVPVMPPGDYEIEAEDESGNQADAEFILSAGIELSQYEGNVGANLAVSGMGFVVNQVVNINYDDIQVTEVDADANGAFSASFVVPASVAGNHVITADDGTNVVTCIFTMESQAPSAPKLIFPEDGAEAKPEAYFDWEEIIDPSGVTYILNIATDADFDSITLEMEDLTLSEYFLTETEKLSTTKAEEPYYWRVKAIDGASNESDWSDSGSFYVSASRFTLSAPARNALIAVGVTAGVFFGFWLGRRTAYSKV